MARLQLIRSSAISSVDRSLQLVVPRVESIMSKMPEILFIVPTPLGFSVRTTREYWELIQHKHPEIVGKEAEVQQCLQQPAVIRRSTQDPTVYLFYISVPPYHLAVVVKRLDGEGFIITSYLTDQLKEGETIWPTSA